MKAVKSLSVALLSTAIGLFALVSSAWAEKREIVDVVGRTVTIEYPVKRIFLGFYYADYMAVGGTEAFDKVVGFSRDVWEVWNPASWNLFREAVPGLSSIPDVGEIEAGTFSLEKLLALTPDVAILADWQFQALGPDIDRIEAAGIPVIVVDYNAQTLERHLASTRVFGEITSRETRAEQIAKEYQAAVELVSSRLEKAGRKRPSVYVEFGNKGPSEYSFTYGKNMWGAMATMAGGDNIATPFVEWWGPMNPEQVLAAKPEVIVITGRETELKKNTESMVMGVDIPRNEAERRLTGFTRRPGWSELPAVKNDRVFAVYQGASRTLADQAMIQFMAKALYPDLFEDIDPERTYIEFHSKYLPVIPQGTFTLSLDPV